MVFQAMFQVGVYAQIEQNLYDLVLKIGKDRPLSRSYNLQQLNLPLISNDYDNEDVMLLAALALGDDDLVERITKVFTKQKLGIGLTKFSARQIRKVIEALQSVEEPRIDINIVGLIVGSGIYDDDFRNGDPGVAFVKEEYNIYDYKALCDAARKCGFYVLNESNFSTKIRGDKNTIQYSLCNRLKGDDQVMLTNFISSFEVSAEVKTTESYQTARPDFSKIKLTGKDSKYSTNVDPKTGKKYKQLKPNEEAITDLFAKKIAARMAQEAATRLLSLAHDAYSFSINEGISLEHIAVSSGYNGDLLRTLESSDQVIIKENSTKIHSTLQATLEKNIPLPEDDEMIGKDGSSSAVLSTEITSFIGSYLRLVTLSYCEIPKLSGKAPSACVPEYNVSNKALQGSCWQATPMMVHSTRRTLIKAERERIIRSRKIVVLGDEYSYVFVVALWLLVSWLSVKSTQVFLFLVSFHLNSFVEVLIGQVLSLWTLWSLTGSLVKSIFHVDADESSWYLVKCCVESVYRAWADYRGLPDPYNTELTRLRCEVREQYSTWKFRIAKRDFYTALKRKRITNRECVLLLTEFAHTYIEKDGEEIVEGELPVKLSEAEEFLKLRVDGQEDCTEISLDAEQALKNYLSRGINSSDGGSAMEGLLALSSSVHSCVEFTEGDRVIVKDEEDVDDYEEESDGSSDKGLKSSALVSRRSKTGSVVFSTATLCFIHFDGEAATTPTPIPIRLCSKLDELPFEEKKKESPPVVTDDENEDDSCVVSSTESTSEAKEEDKVVAPKPQQKARTVEEALIQGGWKLERSKNHLIYSRRVKIDEKETRKQSVAMAKTPSDHRADKKALSLLRKLNEALLEADEDDEEPNNHLTSVCKECLKEKSNMKFSKTQLKKAEKNRKCKACCGS